SRQMKPSSTRTSACCMYARASMTRPYRRSTEPRRSTRSSPLRLVDRALAQCAYIEHTRRLKVRILRALGREPEAATIAQQTEQFVAEQLALIDQAEQAQQPPSEPPSQPPSEPAKRTKWD